MEEVQNHVFEEAAEGSATEKVYIAVGSDIQEGFKTIDWALKKWHNTPISIVLLHFCNILQDFVYTPCTISFFSIHTSFFLFNHFKPKFYISIVGKLPASSVSEEKLEVLRKYEDQKINKLLSKYVTFCGKVCYFTFFGVQFEVCFSLGSNHVIKILGKYR